MAALREGKASTSESGAATPRATPRAATPRAAALRAGVGATPRVAEGVQQALLYVRFRTAAEPGLKGLMPLTSWAAGLAVCGLRRAAAPVLFSAAFSNNSLNSCVAIKWSGNMRACMLCCVKFHAAALLLNSNARTAAIKVSGLQAGNCILMVPYHDNQLFGYKRNLLCKQNICPIAIHCSICA